MANKGNLSTITAEGFPKIPHFFPAAIKKISLRKLNCQMFVKRIYLVLFSQYTNYGLLIFRFYKGKHRLKSEIRPKYTYFYRKWVIYTKNRLLLGSRLRVSQLVFRIWICCFHIRNDSTNSVLFMHLVHAKG